MIERLVFVGSSDFALPSLQLLFESQDHAPILVITQPPRSQGRKLRPECTPVGKFAQDNKIPFIYPENINDPEIVVPIQKLDPDLLVIVSYGGMIGHRLRRAARYGAINLHPSLLPALRGATPIQTALLNGLTETGITIFKLNALLDAGAIYRQQSFTIYPDDNYTTLHDRLADAGAEMLLKFVRSADLGNEKPIPQNDSDATYSRKIVKSDLTIDWNLPAVQVADQIRAFSCEPGARQLFRCKLLKILRSEVLADPAQNIPGSIQNIVKNTGWSVNCADRQILITSVQPAGKAIMTAWAFHLGARLILGELLVGAGDLSRKGREP